MFMRIQSELQPSREPISIEHQDSGSSKSAEESSIQEKMRALSDKVQVVIFGAGPIGLFSALNIRIENPNVDIVILEKRDQYTRSHSVLLEDSIFKGHARDPDLKKLVKEWDKEIKDQKPLPINEIESKLQELVLKKNITILKNVAFSSKREEKDSTSTSLENNVYTISGFDQVKNLFPKAKIIIGADGARSEVRKALFPEETRQEKTLQYTALIRYTTKNPPEKLDLFFKGIGAMVTCQRAVDEYVSRKKVNDGYKVSLQMIIDPDEHESIKEATFKNPLSLEDDMHPRLKESIKNWLDVKRNETKEVPENIQISAVPLNTYISSAFSKRIINGPMVALVGDSAGFMPHRQAINNGIRCSLLLAKSVNTYFKKPEVRNLEQSFKEYNSLARSATKEAIESAEQSAAKVALADQTINKIASSSRGVFGFNENASPRPRSGIALLLERASRVFFGLFGL